MEKFYIKPNNLEEAMVIAKWFDENHASSKTNFYQRDAPKRRSYIGYTNANTPGFACYETCPHNVPKITFDYFVKNILKQHPYEIY